MRHILAILLITSIGYLCGAFILADANFLHWTLQDRFILCLVIIVSVLFEQLIEIILGD